MQIDTGLIWGGIAALGAIWRAYKGYQAHTKKKPYEPFNWKLFLISVLPAMGAGFVAGATYPSLPDIMSVEGITMVLVFFSGGAGIGSLQNKIPGIKKK